MDESSLVRRPTGLQGTVLKLKQRTRVAADHATLADRRCNISFLASICHEEAVQDYLPQVLLSNEHQISLRVLHALQGALPGNIHIWREKSSWNSHKVMRRYLTLLAHCLKEILKKRQVVLLVDVNRAHIDHTILLHARRLSLRMGFVPAKMTRWLQPSGHSSVQQIQSSFSLCVEAKQVKTASGHCHSAAVAAYSLCNHSESSVWEQTLPLMLLEHWVIRMLCQRACVKSWVWRSPRVFPGACQRQNMLS